MITLANHAIHCTCGESEHVELPIQMVELLEKIKAFAAEHEECEA